MRITTWYMLAIAFLFFIGCGDDTDKSDDPTQPDYPDHFVPPDGMCSGRLGDETIRWPYNGYGCNSLEGYNDKLAFACEQQCPGQQCDQPVTCESGARPLCDVERGKYVCLGFSRQDHNGPLICVDVKCEDKTL